MAYRLRPGRGDPATDERRARVLAAARVVLSEQDSAARVTIEAIAARAGVSRTIVTQQFGTIAGVLEALFDHLSERGALRELPQALERPDPLDALTEVIATYARFWDAERELLRRLAAIAAFDRELRGALRTRAEHRRAGLRAIARRLAERGVQLGGEGLDVLYALTSFELLDALAGPDRTLTQAVPAAERLLRATCKLRAP